MDQTQPAPPAGNNPVKPMDMEPKSSKKIIVIILILIVILGLVGGAGYFLIKGQSSGGAAEEEEFVEESVKELQPEDIGLTLELNKAKNGLVMTITKLDGVESIEYEGTYDAEVTEGRDTLTVTKGFGPSTIEVKPGESTITRNDLLFGTCSRNVCKYDDVTSDVTFNMRVNFSNGDVGSIEQVISLE